LHKKCESESGIILINTAKTALQRRFSTVFDKAYYRVPVFVFRGFYGFTADCAADFFVQILVVKVVYDLKRQAENLFTMWRNGHGEPAVPQSDCAERPNLAVKRLVLFQITACFGQMFTFEQSFFVIFCVIRVERVFPHIGFIEHTAESAILAILPRKYFLKQTQILFS
jgi:hypothetical protein